jgi:hypothetical protein
MKPFLDRSLYRNERLQVTLDCRWNVPLCPWYDINLSKYRPLVRKGTCFHAGMKSLLSSEGHLSYRFSICQSQVINTETDRSCSGRNILHLWDLVFLALKVNAKWRFLARLPPSLGACNRTRNLVCLYRNCREIFVIVSLRFSQQSLWRLRTSGF